MTTAVTFKINPKGSYLADPAASNPADPADAPTQVLLSAFGAAPGSIITLKRVGDWQAGNGNIPGSTNPFTDSMTSLMAVFVDASGNKLAPVGVRSYVTQVQTSGVATNIAQDFYVVGAFTQAQVPAGAVALRFSVDDSFFSDNTDPDGDFSVLAQVADGTADFDGGWDLLFGTTAGDTLSGGQGNDSLSAAAGADSLRGGAGDDFFYAGSGADTMDGGDGIDTVDYRDPGYDNGTSTTTPQGVTVNLQTGQATDNWGNTDTLTSIEQVLGTAYNDNLKGGNPASGSQQTDGYEGFRGDAGNDTIDGGPGFDRAIYDNSPAAVTVQLGGTGQGTAQDGWGGTDTLISIEEVRGSSFNDSLVGTDANLFESYEGRAGNDTIIGKGGTDRANYQTSPAGVVVDLGAGTAQDGWGGTDVLSGIERVRGSEHADSLIGSAQNDHFDDRAGNDTIVAGAGDDTVLGTAGNDRIDTGSGLDFVTYASSPSAIQVDMRLAEGQVQDGFGGVDTLIGVEHVTGSAYADTIIGPGASQSYWHVEGKAGADTIEGGTGAAINEIGFAESPAGVVVRLAGWAGAGGSLPPGFTGSAQDGYGTIDVFKNIQWVEGSPFNDDILGDDGRNNIDGRGGNDTINGGGGRDIIEFNQAGGIHVDLSQNKVLDDGQGGQDVLISIEDVDGSAWNDRIYGSTDANLLQGQGGDDYLVGGAGNDTLDGGANGTFGDTVDYAGAPAGVQVDLQSGVASDGTGGTDTLLNIEHVTGTDFNDTLLGSDATNWFLPKAGNDSVDGRNGRDVVMYESSSAGVVIDLKAGTATGPAIGSDTLISIEAAHGSYFADAITLGDSGGYVFGRAGNDTLIGGQGDDSFIPGSGSDSIDGGTGYDLLQYQDDGFDDGNSAVSSQGVSVNLKLGSATDNWGHTDSLRSIELVWGTKFNDSLVGGDPANGSSQTDGFEGFRGEAGNDTIDGGTGFDRAYYDNSPAAITVQLGGNGAGTAQDGWGGTDTLISIEEIRGSAYDDTLTGTDAGYFESFEGRAGNDTITGKGGTDRISFQTSPSGVNVNLITGSASDGWGYIDNFSGIEEVRGSDHADTLVGSEGNNRLEGRAGSDSLLGGLGSDTLTGGAGNDTLDGGGQRTLKTVADAANVSNEFDVVSYAEATASVTVTLGATGLNGTATGADIGADTLINIEYVLGSAYADVISGSNRAVVEYFRGGAGNDTIRGGDPAGTDTGINLVDYREAASAVQVSLAAGTATGGDGNDVLSGIQGVEGSNYGDSLVGDAEDNFFDGRTGNDTIDGAGGRDWVLYTGATGPVNVDLSAGNASGAYGNDVLISIENVRGSAHADALTGSSAANDFQGRGGNDTISGGAGDDTIHGGQGDDSIDGGEGTDMARFTGQRSEYTVTVDSGTGRVTVVDQFAGRDGTDVLVGVEKLAFTDVTVEPVPTPPATRSLEGIAYHWKSHVLMSGVNVGLTPAAAVRADTAQLFDLRAAKFEPGTGALSVEVWANASASFGNFDFQASTVGATAASFASALPAADWSVIAGTSDPQNVLVSGFSLTGASGSIKLGTLQLTLPANSTSAQVLFSQVAVGSTAGSDQGLGMQVRATSTNGSYSFTNLGSQDLALVATRAATDSGNAVTSADALAALRIAVGLNPNPDPDGTSGPKTAPAISPYQIMAADVNGNGTVTSADALAILRMAVKLSTALPQEWFFVEETRDFWNETTQSFTLSRTNAVWDRTIGVEANTTVLNLVGVLKGDVNGSWAAPAGSTDLDVTNPTYFEELAKKIGVPNQDQWGGPPGP